MTSVIDHECFEPIHAAHAIDQVAFIVLFDNLIDDDAFAYVKEISERFSDELPGKHHIKQQGISIPIGGQAPAIQHPLTDMGLIRRSVSRDSTLEAELRIERSSVTFLTTRYTRWNAIWGQASSYFNAILTTYFANANLIAVGLNYVDKFIWKGNLEHCNSKLLIQENSKYICKHVFETNELWHSHTGAFIRIDEITKRLLNINIDCLNETIEENDKRVVSITTSVTDQFNQPFYLPYLDDDNSIAMIDNHMQNMHIFGKDILSQLITEHMSKRIALIQTS